MIVRRARPEDKDDILEISSHIWEGHDYVPLVLDRWLAGGGLFVAELEGKVVGLAKTTILSPGELWFEGLRVHPEYRGRGIAKALAKTQLEEALARAPRSIRLATAEVNHESIHIAEGLGFRELARFAYMTGHVSEGEGAEAPEAIQATIEDKAKLAEFIFNSGAYHQSRGLFPHGWVFYSLTEALLEELIKQGALFWYEDAEGVRGVIALLPGPYRPDRLNIVIMTIDHDHDEDERALSELMAFAHRYGEDRGFVEFRTMVPTERLARILARHGLSSPADFRYALVYEYPLP